MQRVLITGANRGVGFEMARLMSARGDDVIGGVRQGDSPGKTIALDVTETASLDALARQMADASLDLLACNAGAFIGRGGIDDPAYTAKAFAEVMAVNVTGVFLTIQSVLPALRRAKGKIAIISSQMGSSERSKGGAYIYRASKAAATNLACNLAKDLAPEGIAVGAYHPGWVRTDMGGTEADIDTETSAKGLIARFEALSIETTGCFEFYSGEPIPF
jgi:NAD(P)-dependent dehydrogenase (short-subunit alcohol dehydrogenase family)